MKKMYRFKYPSIIAVCLTSRCNLNCKYCISSSNERNIDFDYNKMIEIVDYMFEKGIRCLDLTGGEPTLYPKLHELIQYAKQKNINVSMVTNGLNMSKKEIKGLIEDGIYSIRMSIDSCYSSVHDELRGDGSFLKAINGLNNLLEFGYVPKIQMVIHKRNIAYLNDTIHFFQNKGIKRIAIMPLFPVGRGKIIDSLVLDKHEWKRVIEDINFVYSKYSIKVEADCPIQALYHNRGMNCIAGKQLLVICENGDCIPCSSMNLILGNVYHSSIEDIWKSNIIDQLNDHSLLKGKCSECEVKENCGGGCRALSYEMKGDYLCQDPLCWM